MSELSRRVFLQGGSAAIVAAGAISALPGLPSVLGGLETQGPADLGAADAAVGDTESSAGAGESIVAHVRDLSTGEIGLFTGTREITVLDPGLAGALARALR